MFGADPPIQLRASAVLKSAVLHDLQGLGLKKDVSLRLRMLMWYPQWVILMRLSASGPA
jgi:hypothetical protein